VWGITGWTLVVSESPAQRGDLVALLFLPAAGFPYPSSRKSARDPLTSSAGCCGGPLPAASLPSITVLQGIAIVHFVQRSWPAEILITSGGGLRSIAVPSRGKIRRAKKAAHNPAPAGGRLRRHQRWGVIWVLLPSRTGVGLFTGAAEGHHVMRTLYLTEVAIG
jgi:hypothetical protein